MSNNDDCNGFDGPAMTRRNVLLTLSAAAGLSAAGASPVGGSTAAAADRLDARTLALNHERRTVSYPSELGDPVVVATPLSYNEPHEASTRIDRVRSSGFDATIEEWSYLDGPHAEESVGSLAVETGAVRFDDGVLVQAGTVEAGSEPTRAEFDESFSTTPVVLTGTQTRNTTRPVVTRNADVSTGGVSVRVQTGESSSVEAPETVGFVAVERGSGTLGAAPFEADVVTGVRHEWTTVEFDGEYENPVFLADIQTTDGPDTSTLRYQDLGGGSVEVSVEEERSRDDEQKHMKEVVGYLVIEGNVGTEEPPTEEPQPEGPETAGYGTGGYGRGAIGA